MDVEKVQEPLNAFAILFAAGALLSPAQFREPPREAKPQTWYHLMNGNVTKAGITRDFEALAEAGVGGVQMFDAGCGIPPGDLKFDSPEWFDLLKHAAAEARRLGLEMCLPNCSGYSSSGGPWNVPSNAMKRVVFSRTDAKGPSAFRAKLPRETEDNGYYADIAVLAFPTPKVAEADFGAVRTVLDGRTATLSSDGPFTASGFSCRLQIEHTWAADTRLTIEASEDGRTFAVLEERKVDLCSNGRDNDGTLYFGFDRPRTLRAIRMSFAQSTIAFSVAEARPVSVLPLPGLAEKTFAVRLDVPDETLVTAPGQAVAPERVRDLTRNLASDGTLAWEVPPGEWTILRLGSVCNGRCNHPASECGRGLEVDKLSAAAMDEHFERYVARVCRTLGPLAGDVGTGFNNVLVDSYEVGSQNWTQGLDREFRARCGYDPKPYLPVFAGVPVGTLDASNRFLEDFRRVVADLFAENYAGALARKCHEYGLKCSIEPYGSAPCDDLQYGARCDAPMCEFWSHAVDPYALGCGNAKTVAGIAHVWGRRFCGAEAFTASPTTLVNGRWQTVPFSLKAQGDSAFAHGVNRIIYHRFAHQPWADDRYVPGMTMGRWGMHFDRTQTWWEFVKPWLLYQTRCQYMLQEGTFRADVLVCTGEQAPNDGNAAVGPCEVPAGYDYDVCPSETLYALRAEDGAVLAPGGVRYRLLALPPLKAVSPRMMKRVLELREAGVPVAWTGKPVRAPGLRWGAAGDDEVRRLADELRTKGVLDCSVAEALARTGIAPDFRAASNTAKDEVPGVEFIHRGDGSAEWYFVAMPNRTAAEAELVFRQTGRLPEIWDAETGEGAPADVWRIEDGFTHVTVPFGICGSKFVVFRTPTDKPRSAFLRLPRFEERSVRTVEGPWTVRFPNGYLPNALAKGPEETVTFDRLASWTESSDEGVRYFSGIAAYEKEVDVGEVREGERMFLDLGDVKDLAEVAVNGTAYPALWKPPFEVDVTESVRGAKSVRLRIRVANRWVNRLIGDDRQHEDDCEWIMSEPRKGVREYAIKEIPSWVKRGEKSPTGRCTFTTFKHWNRTHDLLPSGLLGPVRIRIGATHP